MQVIIRSWSLNRLACKYLYLWLHLIISHHTELALAKCWCQSLIATNCPGSQVICWEDNCASTRNFLSIKFKFYTSILHVLWHCIRDIVHHKMSKLLFMITSSSRASSMAGLINSSSMPYLLMYSYLVMLNKWMLLREERSLGSRFPKM